MTKSSNKTPWTSKEWKEQRDKILAEGATCAWCGTTESLSIHHTHETRQLRYDVRPVVIKKLIHEKIGLREWLGQEGGKIVELFICPVCGSHEKKRGKVTTTCKACRTIIGMRHPDTKTFLGPEPNYRLEKEEYKKFVAQYADEIEERIDRMVGSEPDYMDLSRETMILCKACHYAIHKGLHLCPVCKKNYTRYSKCFSCLSPKEKEAVRKKQEAWTSSLDFLDDDDDWFEEIQNATPEHQAEMFEESDRRNREDHEQYLQSVGMTHEEYLQEQARIHEILWGKKKDPCPPSHPPAPPPRSPGRRGL